MDTWKTCLLTILFQNIEYIKYFYGDLKPIYQPTIIQGQIHDP